MANTQFPNSITDDRTLRIYNNTNEPQILRKHTHYGQVVNTKLVPMETTKHKPLFANACNKAQPFQFTGELDPEQLLGDTIREEVKTLLIDYQDVFDTSTGCYNGASGDFLAIVNMGNSQPPQRKGRVPQYSANRLGIAG